MADQPSPSSGRYKRKIKETEASPRYNPGSFEPNAPSTSVTVAPECDSDGTAGSPSKRANSAEVSIKKKQLDINVSNVPDRKINDDPEEVGESITNEESLNNTEPKNCDAIINEDPVGEINDEVAPAPAEDLENEQLDDDAIISETNEHEREKSLVFCCPLEPLSTPLVLKEGITGKDYVLALLAQCLKHDNSLDFLVANFGWMNSILKQPCLPRSQKTIFKFLARRDESFERHWYCQHCSACLIEQVNETPSCTCPASAKVKKVAYYLSINLESQIVELLNIPNIAHSLQYRFNRRKVDPNAIEDIYDGVAYQRLCKPGMPLSNKWNLSLTFNIEAVQVSNSSKVRAYPIWVELNELPPHMRKKHIMLAGIWLDEIVPIANRFASNFVHQMIKLHNQGIVWNPEGQHEVTSRFYGLIFNSDSLTRWQFLLMTHFNELFGCTFCYARGVLSNGIGDNRSYPYGEYECRTDAQHRECGVIAIQSRRERSRILRAHRLIDASHKGIYGPSALGEIPDFNLHDGQVVNTMNNAYFGVLKQHTMLLLQNDEKPWHIGSQRSIIDKRLLSIQPPTRLSRYPRSLKYAASYEASEWRNWGYYCIPCLSGILPDKYLKHLSLICEVFYTYNQSSLTIGDMDRCEQLLEIYIRDFQIYFGIKSMVYNIHLLTHVTETIRNWGPLWVHNGFEFETMNRRIIQTLTNPKSRLLHIYTRFLIHKFLQVCLYDESIQQQTRNHISKLFKIIPDVIEGQDGGKNFTSLGTNKIREPTNLEKLILIKAGYHCHQFVESKKARINGIEYRCCDFFPDTEFSNSTVYCDELGFGEIITIIEFNTDDKLVRGLFIHQLKYERNFMGTTFLNQVTNTNKIKFITVDKLRRPAFQIRISDAIYAIKLPNLWDTESLLTKFYNEVAN